MPERPRPANALPQASQRPSEPDPEWVAELTGMTLEKAGAAIQEAKDDRGLAGAIQTSHRSAGRDYYAQIRAPFELYALVRLMRPQHVVEVGVSSGVSSAYLLRAIKKNEMGKLHSIDLPKVQRHQVFAEGEDSPVALPVGKGSGWAVPPGLRAGWDLRIGPSEQVLPMVASELQRIDLFLHDSLHTFEHATFEFQTVDPKVPSGGVVLADNTDWLGGALDQYAVSKGTRAIYRKGIDLGGVRKP